MSPQETPSLSRTVESTATVEAGGRPRPSRLRHFIDAVLSVVLVCLSVWYLSVHYRLGTVISDSMVPTLQKQDWYLLVLDPYGRRQPRRGDIVLLPDPEDGEPMVKRVVGLAGENLSMRVGAVYIDNRPLEEAYLAGNRFPEYHGPVQVPLGHVYVLGDNRDLSDDSRDFGPVAVSRLEARAAAIVWPPRRARWLRPAGRAQLPLSFTTARPIRLMPQP